ncbi:clostripain-related cysteine peptidase [Candidatus Oscillochloris fontis]|uniref:clostripain-related cysteine peptidase n=1 Tax=Candidatus Oscillochloris fontis TaxID=2496868 RepID=UPI00101B80BC|nr:clostripain-related cysteine peptidase [Candidatus Oscillochloris fontis]
MQYNYRNAVEVAGEAWNTNNLSSTSVIYWLHDDVTVAANNTLTIAAGVKIKADANAGMFIFGKLTANGTFSAPIFFTSEKDDTVCGYGAFDELVCDTDNAVGEPNTGNWGIIEFEDSSDNTSSLTRAVLRYGGYGNPYGNGESFNFGIVRLRNASPTLDYLSMSNNYRNGVELEAGDWNDNTLKSSTVIYWLGGDVRVAPYQTFTIIPGVKIKPAATNSFRVSGTLIADGTPATDVSAANPIIFTSERDDTVCGLGASNEQVCDTNNLVNTPASNNWGFIEFLNDSDDTSSLSYVVVRYGGYGRSYGDASIFNSGAIRLNAAAPTIASVRLQQNYIGIDLLNGAQPDLTTCNDFVGNQLYAMRNNQPASVVNAPNQWWGNGSGPTYNDNPGGTGQAITDGITYSHWASSECASYTPVPPTTRWLVMIYMGGDNQGDHVASLSPPMRELLTRLSSMPYNPNMRLVVLFDGDKPGGGDTYIYTREASGMQNVTEQAARSWLGGMGGTSGAREIDTGSAASLSNFVNWAVATYPGSTYKMLSIIDHGGGWAPTIGLPGQPRTGGDVQAGSWRGMNLDTTTVGGNSLSTRNIGEALRNTTHLDLLFLDACLMGMLENAYELRNYADYLVAGENVLFANLPYQIYLDKDGLTAATSPLGLARRIVANYNSGVNAQDHPFALSVLDLRQLRSGVTGSVPSILNRLAEQISAELPATPNANTPLVQALVTIYNASQKFDYDSSLELDAREGYVDLVDFASRLRDSSNPAITFEIRTTAGELVAAATTGTTPLIDTSRTVSGSYEGKTWNLNGANGLAIFLPLGEQDYRPTKANPSNFNEPFQAERQMRYYADPTQLMLTRDVPAWAALLVQLEPAIPIIRTGPGGLPGPVGASLSSQLSTVIDTRAFNIPGQVVTAVDYKVYLPLVTR